MVDAPSVYSHATRPVAGSMAAMPLPDCRATRVGWPGFFRTTGEVQLAILGRESFHLLTPVNRSSPAVNDSLSFSSMAMTTPSATASEDAIPRLLLAFG